MRSRRWRRRTVVPRSRSHSTCGGTELAGSFERHLAHPPRDCGAPGLTRDLAQLGIEVVELLSTVGVAYVRLLAPRREVQDEQLRGDPGGHGMDARHAGPLPRVG